MDNLKLIPVGDKLYIVVDPMREKQGLIALPDKHSERTRTATVISAGAEVKDLKAGDKVLISWYGGIHIQLPQFAGAEDLHRIIREGEILSKIE